MGVHRHARHSLACKIKSRDRIAQFFREWQHKATQTAIDMKTDVVVESDGSEVSNWVDGTLGGKGRDRAKEILMRVGGYMSSVGQGESMAP